jgi:hypothetical protein
MDAVRHMYDEGRVDVVNVPRTPCIFMLSCEISYEQVPPTIGMSAPAGISLDAMGHFEEEPGASSGVVDPHVDEARHDNIAALLAERPRRAQGAGQYLVVNAKIGEYVLGSVASPLPASGDRRSQGRRPPSSPVIERRRSCPRSERRRWLPGQRLQRHRAASPY